MGEDKWNQYWTPLGTPYAYFLNNYSTTYYGPYKPWGVVAVYTSTKNYWMRQWNNSDPTPLGEYTYYSFGSKYHTYCQRTDYTSAKQVMWAFCI